MEERGMGNGRGDQGYKVDRVGSRQQSGRVCTVVGSRVVKWFVWESWLSGLGKVDSAQWITWNWLNGERRSYAMVSKICT